MDAKRVDELLRRLSEAIPAGAWELKQDFEKNLRAVFSSALAKLDLVTREEFDVQAEVLARTRAKIESLERQVAAIEQQLGLRPAQAFGQTSGQASGAETEPSSPSDTAGGLGSTSSHPAE